MSKNTYGEDRLWPFAQGGGGTIAIVTLLLLASWKSWQQRPSFVTRLLLTMTTGVWMAILWFFRDPHRTPPTALPHDTVLAPGDGKVVAIVPEYEGEHLHREMIRMSIFLNVNDVHVQRVPFGGVVQKIEHRPGRYLEAYRPEASLLNEHISMVVESAEHGPYLIKQIAGRLARRCVNRRTIGEQLTAGQRFGLIRFGSRVDLFLPIGTTFHVQIGDYIYGGVTPIAQLPPKSS